jgi:hypothetical protein
LDVGVKKVEEEWVGGKDYANQTYSTQQRLKIHVKQIRSITFPTMVEDHVMRLE